LIPERKASAKPIRLEGAPRVPKPSLPADLPAEETVPSAPPPKPAPRRSRKHSAPAVRLSLDEAVGRLPAATVELFQERLRGQFREVRAYTQPATETAESGASTDLEFEAEADAEFDAEEDLLD